MIAPDALASRMSLSVMAPTPRWTICTCTSPVDSRWSASASASAGPPWSALMRSWSTFRSPAAACDMKSSRVTAPLRDVRRLFASRSRRCRFWAISREAAASSTTRKRSPAIGTPSMPNTCTGIAGPASFTCLPRSSNMARTRPEYMPQMKSSPTRRVPFCTSTVATGPFPGSSCASTTVPSARRFGFALRSRISAWSSTWSSSSCTFVPFLAETGVASVVPPNSSSTTSCWRRSCFTFCTFACGRSILLIATTIGTPAALACEIASIVCGIT